MASTAKRPGSLSFVAILLIILGSLSCLNGLTQTPSLIYVAVSDEPGPRPAGKPPDNNDLLRMCAKESPSFYYVTGGLTLVFVLFGVGQIICGIGLMKMNAARRMPAIWLTLGKLIFSISEDVYQAVVMGPALGEFFEEAMANAVPPGQPAPQMPPEIASIMQIGLGAAMAIAAVIQLAIFLTIVLILTSHTVTTALAAGTDAPAEEAETPEREPRKRRYEGYEDDEYPSAGPPETGITDRS